MRVTPDSPAGQKRATVSWAANSHARGPDSPRAGGAQQIPAEVLRAVMLLAVFEDLDDGVVREIS